ncbi:uncharacterized protein LOC120583711 isoform X2 [Pteropus medius]|uniref:uncharacterized protein LOC120583711 isoform X2 n=1 Tax=Pteropus vampyrus TaxID=132908 RepID=UPI00196AD71E|nr:uncharacterized protein LOC120583711 isoform X2 [Pteropus giganteus]
MTSFTVGETEARRGDALSRVAQSGRPSSEPSSGGLALSVTDSLSVEPRPEGSASPSLFASRGLSCYGTFSARFPSRARCFQLPAAVGAGSAPRTPGSPIAARHPQTRSGPGVGCSRPGGAIRMPALHGHSDLQGRASPRHVPETLYPAWATLLLCGPRPACGPGAQDKRADQTASQARRLMLPVPFLPSSPRGGLRGTKGPAVASCRPVLGQQVRGRELPVRRG